MAKLNDNERIREILKNHGITDENRITQIFKELVKENRKEIFLDFAQSDASYKAFEKDNATNDSAISESTIRRFVKLFSKDGKSENRDKFSKIMSEIYRLELSPKKEIKIKDEKINKANEEIKIKDEKINKANERTKEQKKLGWRNSKLSLVIIVVLSILFLIYAYCVPKQEFPF